MDKNKDINNKKRNLPDVVRQPYQLTANFIKFNFSAGENRILVRILQRIKVHQEVNYTPQINIEGNIALEYHYRDLLLGGDNAKERLDENLKKLREKTLPIRSKMKVDGKKQDSTKLIGIIEKPQWTDTRTHVQIELDADFYGFLTDLSKGFTEYLAESSFNLTGTYNIKFYYYVRQWFDTGGRTVHTLKQFRKELEIPEDIYRTNTSAAFKSRIIEPAKKMLDEIADVSFNYTELKQGRKIVGYVFSFYKTNNKVPLRHNIERVDEIFELLETNFKLSKVDKSRLVGIMNKYQFSFLKSLINTHYFDIKDNFDKGKDLPNALNKVILDNYDHLFKKEEKS